MKINLLIENLLRLSILSVLFFSSPIYSISLNQQKKIDVLITQFFHSNQIPGLSLCFKRAGGKLYCYNKGTLAVESKIKVSENTIFPIASISKFISVIALLNLNESKNNVLTESIYPYVLKNLKEKTPSYLENITIDNLITHTSGIRHYDPSHYQKEKRYNNKIESRVDAISVNNAIYDKPLFEPGRGFCYSTYAINMVQDVIEQSSKIPFLSYLSNELHFLNKKIEVQGYVIKDKQLTKAPMVNLTWKLAGGGLTSSSKGLANFISSLVQLKIVSKSSYDILSEENPYGILGNNYGRGIHVFKVSHQPSWLGHGGGATGGAGYVLFQKDGAFIGAALANLEIKSSKLGILLSRISRVVNNQNPNLEKQISKQHLCLAKK